MECPWQQNIDKHSVQDDGTENPVRGRVLHVVNGEHYAGAERVQDLLGGALPWFGYEAEIACLKPGMFAQARKSRLVPLFDCPMTGRFDIRPVRTLIRLIRERGYDALHAHTPRSLLIASAASAIARVPLIYHVHSPAVADTTFWMRNRVNAFLERLSLASAKHLIAVSNSLRERYVALGISPKRITTVANGVPCGTGTPSRIRSESEPVVFGMAALFRPRKGLEVLLKAMASLLAQEKQLRLRAIGQFESPEYERQVRSLVADLGVGHAIDWTGFSNDIHRELGLIDCFILPSLFGEGLPMVILEAMSAGRPVIATDVEGTPEAIRHGENGLLARPADPGSLSQVMKQVIDGTVDLQALAERAAADQRERFSVCSMARGVSQVYDRVLGLSGKTGAGEPAGLPCTVLPTCSEPLASPAIPSLPNSILTPIPESPASP